MKRFIRVLGASLVLAVILFGITSHEANALFIKDPAPGGLSFFIDQAHSGAGVSSFSGTVGANNSGPVVNVLTNVNVNTGSGYANIDPAGNAILTTLTFTPVLGTLFGDFSFRGQLDSPGDVLVTVFTNSAFTASQSFTFSGLPGNADFARIGIVSADQTIYRVAISTGVAGGFNQVKQVDFSLGAAAVPEPASLLLIGIGLMGLVGVSRKFRK